MGKYDTVKLLSLSYRVDERRIIFDHPRSFVVYNFSRVGLSVCYTYVHVCETITHSKAST